MILAYLSRTKWYWLSGLLLACILSGALFPSGNVLSRLQVMQAESNVRLSAISKWVLAQQESEEVAQSRRLSNLTIKEKHCLVNALRRPDEYYSKTFDLRTCELRSDAFSDYVILTNQEPIRVMLENDHVSLIVAHEKSGLWPDDTVAIYSKDAGVMRMKCSDFGEVLRGKGLRLKYIRKTYLWTLDKR